MRLASCLASCLALAIALAGPLGGDRAAAQSAKQTMIAAKAGRSNVQIRLVLHPQAPACSAALTREIKSEATRLGVAHVRANLAKLIRQARTDASGDKEFFGVSYLVGCPKDGSAWIAFPLDGKEKSVTRYAPPLGWSPMTRVP
jgi:hypothetical protein